MRPTANHYDYNHYHDDNDDDDSEADHNDSSAPTPTEEDHALQGPSLRRNQESQRHPVI